MPGVRFSNSRKHFGPEELFTCSKFIHKNTVFDNFESKNIFSFPRVTSTCTLTYVVRKKNKQSVDKGEENSFSGPKAVRELWGAHTWMVFSQIFDIFGRRIHLQYLFSGRIYTNNCINFTVNPRTFH